MDRVGVMLRALILISLSQLIAAKIKPVSFIFGDSLSDVGNNNYLSKALAKASLPWYGIDYGNGMPTGRFTNGRTISDIVAEKMGLPIPAPYLDPATDEDVVLSNGVNYASGGGGILNETGWLFIQRLSLSKQIELFEGTKATIIKKIGHDVAETFFNESFYTIAIGSNDYVNNFLLPVAADAWQYTPDEFIDYLVITLRQQLTLLHRLGVRKMLFIGLGPLGCIPLQRMQTKDGGCDQKLNSWAVQYNVAAKKLMDDLNSQLPAASFIFADGYNVVTKVIQNPQAYGFKVANAPCCSLGRYRPTLTCFPAAKLCSDRSKYVFWDEYHPSEAANMVIAGSLMSALNLKPVNSTDHSHQITPASAPSPSPSQ
eukprot:Gb_41351 [translate_table: standard]